MSQSMPQVVVVLLTAHRLDYALDTLDSTLTNLHCSRGLRLHIASDGDDADYINALIECGQKHLAGDLITWTNSGGKGYGANYNGATFVTHNLDGCRYVLPLEDDWRLGRSIDLDVLFPALDDPEVGIGCIRMGYMGWTSPMKGEMRYKEWQHYLLLDPDSPELHVFSGHPRLETVEWERKVGLWPEGHNPGMTEINVAQIRAARTGVAWPMDLVKPCGDAWHHIGAISSYDQGRG